MEPNWIGIAIFGTVLIALNVFCAYQWRQAALWERANPKPRAAWMFEDLPDGTLLRDMQKMNTALARIRARR